MTTLFVSVHSLVEFLFRTGDIDNRIRAGGEQAMREGTRLHKKIQKSRGPAYEAEVPLSAEFDAKRYRIVVEGRADGVLEEGVLSGKGAEAQADLFSASPLVEEIKCTYRHVEKMEEPDQVHLAQALCYAVCVCRMYEASGVRIRLTYCNLETEKTRAFDSYKTAKELEDFFSEVCNRYRIWSDFRFDWKETRTRTIKETVFPFPYRRGQKELAGAVYTTIVRDRKLFLEAPTGSGKTLAVLFPAIRAIGERQAERLFYLTARTTHASVPEEALSLLRQGSGLRFKSVTITAREKTCLAEKPDCNPEACPYAKGHYDRINDAMYDLLMTEDHFGRDTVAAYAQKHRVCPFELALDMSLFADGVICDYNYLFDPFVYLRRFFADAKPRENLFLVDEAHNLAERARDMYSALLSEEQLSSLHLLVSGKKGVAKIDRALEGVLQETAVYSRMLERAGTPYLLLEDLLQIEEALRRLMQALLFYLDDRKKKNTPLREALLKFYLDLFRFRTIAEEVDENYRIYLEQDAYGSLKLRLLCVNPSRLLARCMARGRASVLFSATLLPVQYYKRILGGTPEDYEIYAETSFSPERCAKIVIDDVTSRYTDRSPSMYAKIAKAIRTVVQARRGNYLVFFPSYAFLNEVLSRYRDDLEEDRERILVQSGTMSEEERARFLEAFAGTQDIGAELPPALCGLQTEVVEDPGITGFCVLGGIFSEGIDLPLDRLIGVCVVGTGLPQVGTERDILKKGFDEQGVDGFDYAYRFPGMNRVLQAAGRVIRTSRDVGVIALLDERFREPRMKALRPREWQGLATLPTEAVNDFLIRFWAEWEEPS